MPSLGIAPHSGSCLGRAGIPKQSAAPVSGVFPADGILRLLEIRLQAIQLSPCRAGPSTRCSYAWTQPLIFCHAVFPLSFRSQVRHQTQKHPSKFLPAKPGIQRSASWRSGPNPPDLEPAQLLRGFSHWFTRVTPSGLACRTRRVWQYRAVLTLSGLLAALTGVPRSRLPPASLGPLRRPDDEGFTPPYGHVRLVAHALVVVGHPALLAAIHLHVGGIHVDRHRPQQALHPLWGQQG
jgi:hypothetical protein